VLAYANLTNASDLTNDNGKMPHISDLHLTLEGRSCSILIGLTGSRAISLNIAISMLCTGISMEHFPHNDYMKSGIIPSCSFLKAGQHPL